MKEYTETKAKLPKKGDRSNETECVGRTIDCKLTLPLNYLYHFERLIHGTEVNKLDGYMRGIHLIMRDTATHIGRVYLPSIIFRVKKSVYQKCDEIKIST